jgi:hypothetical protein
MTVAQDINSAENKHRNKQLKINMKHKLTLMAAAVVLMSLTASVQAVPIRGSISFNGDETAFSGTGGTGSVDGDLSTAKSIVFNSTTVSTAPAPNQSFTGLGGLAVTMTPFLNINPAALPAGAVWSVGGFSMTLTSLGTIGSPTQTSLVLGGFGMLSDGIPADNNTGIWTATFTSSGPGSTGVTFSWNSSSSGTVPDGGTTVLLLGAALSGLGLLRKKLTA